MEVKTILWFVSLMGMVVFVLMVPMLIMHLLVSDMAVTKQNIPGLDILRRLKRRLRQWS